LSKPLCKPILYLNNPKIMAQTQPLTQSSENYNVSKSTKEKVRNTLTEEIIVGICAPIGSLREPVINKIVSILRQQYKYDVQILKLSSYINQYEQVKNEPQLGETEAYTFLMNKISGGDSLRLKFGPSILAELAIHDIHVSRHQHESGKLDFQKIEHLKSRRKCFIIDSIKNKEELELLQDLYKDIFYCFSIFSPLHEREENLRNKGLSKDEIKRIIDTDNFENHGHGQNFKDTFVEADFFVRVSQDNLEGLEAKLDRYINIIFESAIVTPFPHEIAMYEAKSAAGNSACLSRQVGAAITNKKGEIISRGWNDVPKFGGNLYKEGDEKDSRCKFAGYCSNDSTKDEITDEILSAILKDKYLTPKLFGDSIASEELEKIKKIIRRNSRVKDLIEFSRSVHAEMHAIIIGSQLGGNKMVGGKLFCTTYPCHNCARHIIVAGIEEIYYIEPYTKSLGLTLHKDAITEDETDATKVRLLVYDGVAPRRYMEFFIMRRPRKDSSGKVDLEMKDFFKPKSRLSLQALPTLEQQAIHSLYERGILKNE
jgi:deoxycytidylate deaminase